VVNQDDFNEFDPIIDEIISLYSQGHTLKFHSGLFNTTAKKLTEAFAKPFKVDFEQIDYKKLDHIKQNIFLFSGAKTIEEFNKINELLIDPTTGQKRPYHQFKKEVLKINQLYNKRYLKTEYDAAVAVGSEISKWNRYTDGGINMDVLLEYVTVGDPRVRKDHQILDGIIQPANSKFWQEYAPIKSWNCRCTISKVLNGKPTKIPKDLPLVQPVFKGNAFTDGKIFSYNVHNYFKNLKPEEKKLLEQVITEVPGLWNPAKSVQEAIERLSKFTISEYNRTAAFKQETKFDGIKLEPLNSMLKAVEDTLGTHNTKVNQLGTHQKKNALGLYYRGLGPNKIPGLSFDSDAIHIQKSLINNPAKAQKSCQESFTRSLEYRKKQIQDKLGTVEEGYRKIMYTKELETLNVTKRWAVFQEPGVDPLYATMKHEAYHAVWYRHNLERTFQQMLDKFDVDRIDWFKVSEYGASKIQELWTETGTAIDCGLEVPENLEKAFKATVATIKK
jgi:hypothetical protein